MSAHKNKRRGSSARGSQKTRKVNRNGWLSHDEQMRRRTSSPPSKPKPSRQPEVRLPGLEQRRWH